MVSDFPAQSLSLTVVLSENSHFNGHMIIEGVKRTCSYILLQGRDAKLVEMVVYSTRIMA